jgi:hypothetical protein
MFVGGPTWETIGLGKKMTNGLLSKSSSTMVQPPGKKMGSGAIAALYIYICSTASSGYRMLLKL